MEQALKDKLEKEGEMKSRQIVKETTTGAISTADASKKCLDIIAEGAKEFKEKTGRPMTYSDMRALYG